MRLESGYINIFSDRNLKHEFVEGGERPRFHDQPPDSLGFQNWGIPALVVQKVAIDSLGRRIVFAHESIHERGNLENYRILEICGQWQLGHL